MESICESLAKNAVGTASEAAKRHYPFTPVGKVSRTYTAFQSMEIFLRDGFVDRYSGTKLVFPGVIRLLSQLLPENFPFHRNWKISETHPIYWELFPTVDHLLPVARGGEDSPENWVCASMRTNQAKANWTVEELGWKLHLPGTLTDWDGLTGWFLAYVDSHPDTVALPYMKRWYSAANRTVRDA